MHSQQKKMRVAYSSIMHIFFQMMVDGDSIKYYFYRYDGDYRGFAQQRADVAEFGVKDNKVYSYPKVADGDG